MQHCPLVKVTVSAGHILNLKCNAQGKLFIFLLEKLEIFKPCFLSAGHSADFGKCNTVSQGWQVHLKNNKSSEN